MAAAELPDYVLDPDAVLKDSNAAWRYGRAPDYSKTRKFFEEGKAYPKSYASIPIHLILACRKNPIPHCRLSPRSRRKPRQELGNRSLLQNLPRGLAHGRQHLLQILHERRTSPGWEPHAARRHVQRASCPEPILRSREPRFQRQP